MCLARDNVTHLSNPDSHGDVYTASFELFPFHEGSSYSFFMGIMNGNGPLRGHFCVVRAMLDKCAKARDWTYTLRRSYEAARLASEFNKLLGYVAVTVQIPILTQVETVSDFSCLFRCLKPHEKYLRPDEFVTIEPFLHEIFQNFDSSTKTSVVCAEDVDDEADEEDLGTCFCTHRKSTNLKSNDNDRNSNVCPSSAYRRSRDFDFTNDEDGAMGYCTSSSYRKSNIRNYKNNDKNASIYSPSEFEISIDEDFADEDDLGSCLCISAAFRKSKTRDCTNSEKFSDFESEALTPNCLLGNTPTNIATAFSHFSWHFTRKLLVCNLQGVSNGVSCTFTNPTIHSTSRQFGEGDGSIPAILEFFSSHRCSNICRKWDRCGYGSKPQRRVSFENQMGDSGCLSRLEPVKQQSPFLLRDNCLGTLL
ncbi:unnamed protein product [Candidula unifasciata]|uniref:Alpha-type protein kinase domain-containing protein n=1 Tax=Candidula unifasciata TaxID=100452 RepID=A0A8S4A496_9EUPU|nr:unnamed protein product [Candidula unifasciata]